MSGSGACQVSTPGVGGFPQCSALSAPLDIDDQNIRIAEREVKAARADCRRGIR